MRVPLQWLSDYIDLPTTDVAELTRAFDYLGHAVESVDVIEADWTDVFVGRVERIESHPDADKVRVTHVDLGDGELHQIICGAWNFEEGAVVPVAVPGAVLPGGFEIGRRSIRGVESNGMICSESELGLGDLHEGIMVLDPATPLGGPFADVVGLPDVVFDLEVTNNRPDVMGMVGVARELAAWYDIPYRTPPTELVTTSGSPAVAVTISAPDGCNRFVAREIRNLEVGESPLWMRERLRRVGVRSISNVVDVTNYVMFELGHPLHAFDADQIAGDRLDVRWATDGEYLTTLDGTKRTLTPQDLVIVDADGPTSLAAVMGGARSEVGEDTTTVLMESASWHPATVMYTSRRHDLRSEASARFERGVDPNLAPAANARACDLLVQIGGGEIVEDAIDVVAHEFAPWVVTMIGHDVRRLLGEEYTTERSAELLGRLDLDVAVDGEQLSVSVPTYRPDLTRPADLIEEIARLADYDTFGETLPTGPAGGLTPAQSRTRRLHGVLSGFGMHQVMNLPFVSPEELDAFSAGAATDVVTVRNPLRDDQAKLRQQLLPALLRNVRDNVNRGAGGAALFETGRTFYATPWADDRRVPAQPMRLAVAIAGPFGMRTLGQSPDHADGATALAVVDAIGRAMGRTVERRAAVRPGLHPKRSADVIVDGAVVGFAGELHPEVAALFELDMRVAVIEVELDPIVSPVDAPQMLPVSTYPHVDFDLSFELASTAAAADLIDATVGVSSLVEAADVFDEYRPEGSDHRSIAIRYRLRATDRTLDSAEIAADRERMIEAAAALGATLRGAKSGEA
jgi:phenylalanyl-tRNA synthetase beta chain